MNRVVVLGVDGLSYTLLKQLVDSAGFTNFARLAASADFRQMDSVYPTVSSAAWTSFITGKQPGKHGLYGFAERNPGSYDVTVPLSTSVRSKNIWQLLSERGLRVFGMNVPVTYPPVEVNGILIGDFLCPSIDKVAASSEVRLFLRSINYQIDSDVNLGRKSAERLLRNLHLTLDKRMQAMFHFLAAEEWGYFHTHVMETDRLCHFLLGKYRAGDARYAGEFLGFLDKLDGYLGKLMDMLPRDCALVVLSDHGFCPIKSEVQLSRYLVEKGWTTPASAEPLHPLDIDPSRSKAYSLIPGRIYVNVAGREPGGIVPREEYDAVRSRIAQDLLALRAPNRDRVIRHAFKREEVFWPEGAKGPNPRMPIDEILRADSAFGTGPDLIAAPFDGYDLKMGLGASATFATTELEGMHTYDDAMILSRGVALPEGCFSIVNVTRCIFKALGIEPPEDLD